MGVREQGENKGQPYRLFMQPYGYKPGTLWCGLFVYHVFRTANVQHGVKGVALARSWGIPASAIVWRYGVAVDGRTPMAGDVALFQFRGRSKPVNHVEIIISWPPGRDCWVIGGNTSNPDNPAEEGVFAKRRRKSEMMVASRIALMYS